VKAVSGLWCAAGAGSGFRLRRTPSSAPEGACQEFSRQHVLPPHRVLGVERRMRAELHRHQTEANEHGCPARPGEDVGFLRLWQA
jgi:hypothetical protein